MMTAGGMGRILRASGALRLCRRRARRRMRRFCWGRIYRIVASGRRERPAAVGVRDARRALALGERRVLRVEEPRLRAVLVAIALDGVDEGRARDLATHFVRAAGPR